MANLDLSALPAKVTITNNDTKPRRVAISGTNQAFIVEPGNSVSVRAELSTELIGYLSQDDSGVTPDGTSGAGLQVTYEAITNGEG